jgi:DNA replication protein DnaC
MVKTETSLITNIISDEICPHCGKNIIFKSFTIFGVKKEYPQMCPCKRQEMKAWREEEEIREKNNKIARLLRQSKLGERFKNASFNKVQITEFNKKAVEALSNFVDNFEKDKSFLLSSSPGTGKTLLVSSVVNGLVKKNRSAIFVIVPDLLQDIRNSYSYGSDIKESQIMYGLAECDCLVLDDLGAESHKGEDKAQEQLFRIINNRYANNKSTIFTTNDSSAQLRKKLGDRTLSRIMEMCKGNTFTFSKIINKEKEIIAYEKDWRLS